MKYQFPQITLPGDIPAVIQKVREELTEYMQACNNREGEERELEEFADAWQAFETLHRRMVDKHGVDKINSALLAVVAKNFIRGYYGWEVQQVEVTDLAESHWAYIEGVLQAHNEDPDIIAIVGHHYRTAFVHGFGHGVEECSNGRASWPITTD